MPAPYGVTSTGFNKKRLPEILADIEASNQLVFGSGVIQTPQSPLGQLNGVFAYETAIIWDIAQAVYANNDVSQAEGANLDRLAMLIPMVRIVGESDNDFRRRVIGGGANEYLNTDALNAVKSVAGVTCAFLYENSSDGTDKYGIPSHSVSWCVVGGDDVAVANVIESWTENGIGTYGNKPVSVNDVTGVCRTVSIMRPKMIPCLLSIVVEANPINCGCQPPSAEVIRLFVASTLTCNSECGIRNGESLNIWKINQALAKQNISGLIVKDVLIARKPVAPTPPAWHNLTSAFNFAFDEMPTFSPLDIMVSYA